MKLPSPVIHKTCEIEEPAAAALADLSLKSSLSVIDPSLALQLGGLSSPLTNSKDYDTRLFDCAKAATATLRSGHLDN